MWGRGDGASKRRADRLWNEHPPSPERGGCIILMQNVEMAEPDHTPKHARTRTREAEPAPSGGPDDRGRHPHETPGTGPGPTSPPPIRSPLSTLVDQGKQGVGLSSPTSPPGRGEWTSPRPDRHRRGRPGRRRTSATTDAQTVHTNDAPPVNSARTPSTRRNPPPPRRDRQDEHARRPGRSTAAGAGEERPRRTRSPQRPPAAPKLPGPPPKGAGPDGRPREGHTGPGTAWRSAGGGMGVALFMRTDSRCSRLRAAPLFEVFVR